jgi:predicted secreted protein
MMKRQIFPGEVFSIRALSTGEPLIEPVTATIARSTGELVGENIEMLKDESNSRLFVGEASVPQSGIYTVRVESSDPKSIAEFTFRVEKSKVIA